MLQLLSRIGRLLPVAAVAIAGLASSAPAVAADPYPSKPIKMIVAFPPGSGSDSNARFLAKKLQEVTGQSVIVENRPGASAIIGTQYAAQQPADGYTILMTSNSPMAVNVAQFESLPYEPLKDFEPIVTLSTNSMILVVPAASPIRTVADLTKAAKTKKLKYGSGSTAYKVASEWYASFIGATFIPVPYKGPGPALVDVAGNQLDFTFIDFGAAVPFLQSGKVRAIATTGDKRQPGYPDLPTLIESGFPGFSLYPWNAVVAPAKTPKPIIEYLHKTIVQIYSTQEAKEFTGRAAGVVMLHGMEEMRKFHQGEIAKWVYAAKKAGIKPEPGPQ